MIVWIVDIVLIFGHLLVLLFVSQGIGYETAFDLAKRGARVIIGCRCHNLGTNAAAKLRQETKNEDVVFKILDLSSLTSVLRFADDLITTENRLDVLINNAGGVGML